MTIMSNKIKTISTKTIAVNGATLINGGGCLRCSISKYWREEK